MVILGCQRSGTTLLREILNTGSIHMIEENWILAYFQRERWHANGLWHRPSSDDTLEQQEWDTAVRQFVESTYGRHFARNRKERHIGWGTKAPGLNMARSIPYVSKIFPSVRYVIMTRDPRDVLASMKASPGMVGNLPSNFAEGCINSPDLVEIYHDLYAYWGRVYSALEVACSTVPTNFLTLRYEEMMTHPSDAVQAVCQFLSIPFSPSLVEPFCRKISNASVVSMNHDDYERGDFVIAQSAVGRWKKDLSRQDLDRLIDAGADVASRWGYVLP